MAEWPIAAVKWNFFSTPDLFNKVNHSFFNLIQLWIYRQSPIFSLVTCTKLEVTKVSPAPLKVFQLEEIRVIQALTKLH